MRTRSNPFVPRLLAGVILLTLFSAVCAGAESILLPGVDVRETTFTVGAWCRYLVVDEAEGIVDSSALYVAVVGEEGEGEHSSYWVELESGPYRSSRDAREVYSVLISNGIRRYQEGDSLCQYVELVYIMKGAGPVEAGDPRDLQQLSLTFPTENSAWTIAASTIETPVGLLECTRRELTLEDSREIKSGKVKLHQRSVDRFQVWTSAQVPIFHLVRCIIDRSRETRSIPRIPGVPEPGPRDSRTTSTLIEYGDGARPIIPLPSEAD